MTKQGDALKVKNKAQKIRNYEFRLSVIDCFLYFIKEICNTVQLLSSVLKLPFMYEPQQTLLLGGIHLVLVTHDLE